MAKQTRSLAVGLLALVAAPWAVLAFVTVVGTGALRRGSPAVVTLVALAIVFFPALGPTALFPVAARGVVLLSTLLLWSMGVLAMHPLFFPGERADSVATGLAIAGDPPVFKTVAVEIEKVFPSFSGARPPPPKARPLEDYGLADTSKGPIELQTEGDGHSFSVSVRVAGRQGTSQDLRFLFDTGASLTTLTSKQLEALGIPVDDQGPTVRLRTAAGEVESHLALIDKLWIAGVEVPNVTVAVCEPCADGAVSGLLGLNVSSQFIVNLDSARKTIQLQRRTGDVNRILDVSPWIKIRTTATSWLDGRVEVEVAVDNTAGHIVGVADVAIRCSETFIAEVRAVPARGTAKTLVSLPRGVRCDEYSAAAERLVW